MSYLRREHHQQRGTAAEQLALEHLQAQGLTLVARNYRCRMGEIDLVMRDADSLVFVEVRLRGRSAFAGAAESIDARKQGRIIAAAHHYLMGKPDQPCRFDCVLLSRLDPGGIEWLRAAFTL
jgi:putative endonuclease